MEVVIVRPMDFLEPSDDRTYEAVLCAIENGVVVPLLGLAPYGSQDDARQVGQEYAAHRGLPCLIGNAAVVDFLKGPALQDIAAAAKATEVFS